MLCAISGQVPEEPVVSAKSGHVFERRLAEKFVTANGKCPVTGEPLTLADLVPLRGYSPVAKPRVAAAASIPGMLQLFQSEWDAVVLEAFTLKQQLDSAKQELAHTLYRHDAACRVIARLVKERDEARRLLAEAQQQQRPTAATTTVEAMDVAAEAATAAEPAAPTEVPEDVKARMVERAGELSKARRKRTPAAGLAAADAVRAYGASASLPLHGAGHPGVLCMDMRGELAATGGVDGGVCVVGSVPASPHVVAQSAQQAHPRRVLRVALHPSAQLVVSASADGTARAWALREDSETLVQAAELRAHDAAVAGLALHAATGGDILATASQDRSWALWDVRDGGRLLARVRDERKADAAFTCAAFHPDGLILATGCADNATRVWDLKARASVVALFEGHAQPVTDVAFSENGFYMATSSEDGSVKLWDLRKLTNFQTLEGNGNAVRSVAFDWSGQYIAAASGADVAVFHGTKKFEPLATYAAHTEPITTVRFGPNAGFVASVSMDRTFKVFGALPQ